MSVFAQHNTGEYYFTFDCPQWAAMDEEATAEWTVLENSCGYIEGFGSPYARGLFGASLNGKIKGLLPITVETVDGITNVDLPDYLLPVSKNSISAAITAGAVTSISVTDALLLDEYQDGDVFSVVDTETGRYVQLEVTTNTGAGDFTISVTGTADDELPIGSVLVPIFSVRSAGGGSGTVTSIGYVAPAAGFSISGTNPVTNTGTWTFALTNDLLGLEGLSGTGIAVRSAADTWVLRSVTNGTGISVTNGDGVSGNIEITNTAPDQTVVLTEGAGIDITGTYPNFTIANTFTNNQSLLDDGTPVTGRPKVNFIDTSTIAFTLTDDAPNTETEIAASVVDGSISNAKLRDSAGLSVIGRSANSTGDPADITAGTDGHVLRRSGTTLGFGTVVTAGIADDAITTAKIVNDAVTLAKLQNAVANNIVLGNISGAGAAYAELTTAQMQTMLGYIDGNGTGVANQVAYFIDANTIGSDASLTIDATNNRTTVSGTVASTTAGQAWLNVRGGSITGSVNAIHADANVSANYGWVLENVRNLAGAAALIEVKVGGTTAADPYMLFTIPSGTSYALGVDNSDTDKFKITPGGTAPGSTANKGFVLTTDASSRAGINKDAPQYELDVNGTAQAKVFAGFKGTPTGTLGTGAGVGSGGVINTITGGSFHIYLSFTTGTTPIANGDVITVVVPWAMPLGCVVWLYQRNANAATDFNKFYQNTGSATDFVIKANGTLAASTTYIFNILITSNTGG